MITGGGDLKCKYLIHTVLPQKSENDEVVLRQIVKNILERANLVEDVASISMPFFHFGPDNDHE